MIKFIYVISGEREKIVGLEKNMNFTVDSNKVQSGQLITEHVQSLIDKCSESGGGEIIFPQGEYVLSTVFLKSNVTVVLNEGALLLGSLNFDDYRFDEPVDYPLYQDASHSFFHCSMFVGEHVENVSIVGKGKIDMRSIWDDENKRNMHHRGPKTIALKYCNNVFIRDISIYNTTDLAVYFAGCENVEIDGVKMRVYIDGISPDCSKNVIIRNCDVESGDDGIVFKSSYTLNKLDICKNILVENCKVKSRCSAIKFGTETNGGFEDIRIKNIDIRETRITGIAIESVDGAILNNIYISDVTMKNVAAPLFIHLGNRLRAPEGTKVGSINNVTIENVTAEGPYVPYEAIEMNYDSFIKRSKIQYPWTSVVAEKSEIEKNQAKSWQTTSNVCGLRDTPLKNIVLRNIKLKLDGGCEKFDPIVPEKADGYPEVYVYGKVLPAKGIYFRYIDGLTLDGVEIDTYRKDVREAFVFEQVKNCKII